MNGKLKQQNLNGAMNQKNTGHGELASLAWPMDTCPTYVCSMFEARDWQSTNTNGHCSPRNDLQLPKINSTLPCAKKTMILTASTGLNPLRTPSGPPPLPILTCGQTQTPRCQLPTDEMQIFRRRHLDLRRQLMTSPMSRFSPKRP